MAAGLEGVKVIEVAGWTFVPAGGGMLADWSSDVIKIGHPETGDPQRGLSIGTVGTKGVGGVSFAIERPNRSKRSLGLNIASGTGQGVRGGDAGKADFDGSPCLSRGGIAHMLIQRPGLIAGERSATGRNRFANRVGRIALLREAFAARPLAEWRRRMAALGWDAIVALKLNNTVN